jgi:hypothetical protein
MQDAKFSLAIQTTGLEELVKQTERFIHSAKASATRKAQRSNWKAFEQWCQANHLPALPSTPHTVALYIASCALDLKSATIARRLSSISRAHQAAAFADSPASPRHFVVGETFRCVSRAIGRITMPSLAFTSKRC